MCDTVEKAKLLFFSMKTETFCCRWLSCKWAVSELISEKEFVYQPKFWDKGFIVVKLTKDSNVSKTRNKIKEQKKKTTMYLNFKHGQTQSLSR